MWRYSQSTGRIWDPNGVPVAAGYSGAWDGKTPLGGPNDHRNRGRDQPLHKLGPIPVGTYDLGEAFDDTGGKGPVVMHLVPRVGNEMFGRSGFMVHGDRAPPHTGEASEGCIILNRPTREALAASPDRALQVVP